MSKNLYNRLRKYENDENWEKAIEITLKLLQKEPESHWLLTRLSSSYYELKNYKKALKYSEKAIALEPDCPLVLWDYAGVLNMLGYNDKALRIWKYLIMKGVIRIAFGDCGEGIRWAKSLINDCRFRIGKTYLEMKDYKEGSKFVKAHLKHRQRGLPSLYSKNEALELMSLQK